MIRFGRISLDYFSGLSTAEQSCKIFKEKLMEIKVEFFASLKTYSPKGENKITLRLQAGATLEDLWAELGIPEKVERICLVNGTYCSQAKALQAGDIVSLLPMIDGG